MRYYPVGRRRRGGVTLVESTLLLSIFLLFLFGVFEYARLMMILHVTTNAARSGARHASVNVDKPSNFVTVDSGTTLSIKNHVISQMAGQHNNLQGASGTAFNVTAFPCDINGLYSNPVVITPKAGYTSWNQASFTERIAVQVTGQYQPILPGFVFFYTGSTNYVPISITAAAGSEG
jgi:Flp pilus assembly protein TadG